MTLKPNILRVEHSCNPAVFVAVERAITVHFGRSIELVYTGKSGESFMQQPILEQIAFQTLDSLASNFGTIEFYGISINSRNTISSML
jgi:hypothetical protein